MKQDIERCVGIVQRIQTAINGLSAKSIFDNIFKNKQDHLSNVWLEEFRDRIFMIHGIIEDYNDDGEYTYVIIKDDNGKILTLYISNYTIVGNNQEYILGDTIRASYLFVTHEWGMALTAFVGNESELISFVEDPFARIVLCSKYLKLKKSKSDRLIEQRIRMPKQGISYDNDKRLDSVTDMILCYLSNKDTYSKNQQRSIEKLFRELENPKSRAEEKLKYIFNILPFYSDRNPFDKDRFMKLMGERFYKMTKQKEVLTDLLISNEKAGKRGCNILLEGPPGTGKTSFARLLSEVINIPFEEIQCNVINSLLDLSGLDSSYEGATPGRISDAFYKNNTSEMVLYLDEPDKMATDTTQGNPQNALLNLSTGSFEDAYVETPISTVNTIIMISVNSIENLSEALLNRFNIVISFDGYSNEDRVCIGRDFVLPRLKKELCIEDKNYEFSDEVLYYIASKYCADEGARDMTHNLEIILRHLIANDYHQKYVTKGEVSEILDLVIDKDDPGIVFNKNRDCYSPEVAKEISKCLSTINVTNKNYQKAAEINAARMRLEYLIPCREASKEEIKRFDIDEFRDILTADHYGMKTVIDEITSLFCLKSKTGGITNTNYALNGGMDIGKTSICKSIAKAMGYYYAEISLNGMKDVSELKGFPRTYQHSEPGLIVKRIKEAGNKGIVFMLGEIDKMDHAVAYALRDILDKRYIDSFFGIPIDLSQCIFIATSNDWGNVDPVIRDRFVVINIDGYSADEKMYIIENHIIPKVLGSIIEDTKIIWKEDSLTFLVKNYCKSFGVRDAEKSIERLVGYKLRTNSEDTEMTIYIDDIVNALGPVPIARGNFPSGEPRPGITKALAVNANGTYANPFAIETIICDTDDGRASISITGLPKDSAKESVEIAYTYVKKHYPLLFKGKEVHLHFAEGGIVKDGPSAGLAITISMLSAALGMPIPYDVSYTGEIDLFGGVYAIGGTKEKILSACSSGCNTVFIPRSNYDQLAPKFIEEAGVNIIPVENVNEVIEMLGMDYNSMRKEYA